VSEDIEIHAELDAVKAKLQPIKVTGSLAYDVSAITEEAPNADTKIISINNATYPMYRIEKIGINIKGWHDVADADETLKILKRVEIDDGGAIGSDDDGKIKTYTEGTDDENVTWIDDVALGVDMEIYVYTGAAMDAVDDFTIYWHYLLTPL